MQLPLTSEHYYLANFLTALSWISCRYEDLLCADGRRFVSAFPRLPLPSQALMARLVMRKGPHFRLSALDYPEIGNIEEAVPPLVAQGWLREDAELCIETLLPLLRKQEVMQIFATVPTLRGAKKRDMLALMQPLYPETQPFHMWCVELQDKLLSLTVGGLCDELRLIFFGNLYQSWSEFVLADLGIFRYEQVPFTEHSRGFTSRRDIEQYLHLHRCRESFDAGEDIFAIVQQLEGFASSNVVITGRHAKLLFRMAQQLERAGDHDAALELYSRSQFAGARHRRIRILEKQQKFEQAYELASAASQAPESDAEAQLIERVLQRIGRKLKLADYKRCARRKESRLDLTLPCPDGRGVEGLVREHMHSEEGPVHYVENALINSLFGLLCWDAIFAPLPGAFYHPFHSAPADLHNPDFHQRRKHLFDDCLAELQSEAYRATILRNFVAKQGIQSPFVFWSALSEELLRQALDCLPPAHLDIWFRRLLLDIKTNRTGMPDLIQFWPAEKRYRMIEVKGPGDRLQDNQRRWLALCAEHDMPVEVCYVRWAEA